MSLQKTISSMHIRGAFKNADFLSCPLLFTGSQLFELLFEDVVDACLRAYHFTLCCNEDKVLQRNRPKATITLTSLSTLMSLQLPLKRVQKNAFGALCRPGDFLILKPDKGFHLARFASPSPKCWIVCALLWRVKAVITMWYPKEWYFFTFIATYSRKRY